MTYEEATNTVNNGGMVRRSVWPDGQHIFLNADIDEMHPWKSIDIKQNGVSMSFMPSDTDKINEDWENF